jgi:putative methyltransferase
MLIYLGDLCYFHEWDNIQPIPLNIGYIAAYLKNKHPETSIELFKDPIKLQNRISQNAPDILALSHYEWNSNLNLLILKKMKEKNPNTITVMGGPNFETYDLEWIAQFFQERPNLDAYIAGEGEFSFTRFVELLDTYEKRLTTIPVEELPASVFFFDKISNKIINNPTNFVERLDLTNHPSPYLTGILDPFLDDPHLAPIIETNRGCPYACTFCNWGNATQSKINQFSINTVNKEIQYIAKRTKNSTGFMYIADANFGILKRDLEIAKVIRDCTDKEHYPQHVFIYFAKNTTDTIVNIASILKTVTSMSMSKQTMNQDVLMNIKRKNIPVEQYDDLREKCHDKGIETYCELIYALPGENYQSFIDGVRESARNNVSVTIYANLMLHGTEQSTKLSRKQYGIKTAYRIIPRYISSHDELPSLEYEEVVVETNTLPRNDFFRIRFFQFLFYIFRSEIFLELTHSLYINGLDYVTLIEHIAQDEKNWTPKIKQLFNDFYQNAKDELFADKKLEFTLEEIKKTRIHNKALNPFYMSKIITSTELIYDFKLYLLECFTRFFGNHLKDTNINELKQTVNFAFDKLVNYENLNNRKILSINYDISAWLDDPAKLPLEEFRVLEPIKYVFELDDYILSSLEKVKGFSNDLTETVYRLRTNEMGPTGDKIFCYKRTPLSAQVIESIKISKREASRRHVELAERSV